MSTTTTAATTTTTTTATTVDTTNSGEYLLDIQAVEPSPGTKFYQLLVQEKPEKRVILREWPKQRFSQKYSNAADPVSKKFTFDEYMDLEDKIRWIFGEEQNLKIKKLLGK